MNYLAAIAQSVEHGNAPKTKMLSPGSVRKQCWAVGILNLGIMPALRVLGDQLNDGTISLPEVMISVGAVKAGLSLLKPFLVERVPKGRGVVVIGTVAGDVHSLGKDLVVIMLEGSGFQVVDIGSDVHPRHFIKAVVRHKADIVALSGLLTISRLAMRETIGVLEESGLRDNLFVIVGGGAVDRQSAEALGADAYGEDASVAPEIALKLLKEL